MLIDIKVSIDVGDYAVLLQGMRAKGASPERCRTKKYFFGWIAQQLADRLIADGTVAERPKRDIDALVILSQFGVIDPKRPRKISLRDHLRLRQQVAQNKTAVAQSNLAPTL